MPKLILYRGLPGSGKTTAAMSRLQELKDQGIKTLAFSADDYFMGLLTGDNNKYEYDSKHIGHAHKYCENMTRHFLEGGWTVIVHNTFVQRWEMSKYEKMAKMIGVEIEINTCKGSWKNVHDVGDEVLEKMKRRWQD